jgi:hypothetical protein
MVEEPRTRFTWTWAGILAGVVLAGASYGSWQPAQRARAKQEPVVRLAQFDPNAPGTGTGTTGQQPTPGVTPTPGTSETPFVTGTDAGTGVGGSGSAPPSTAYTGQDAGTGTPSIPTPGTGTGGAGGIPSVGGMDGGMGF